MCGMHGTTTEVMKNAGPDASTVDRLFQVRLYICCNSICVFVRRVFHELNRAADLDILRVGIPADAILCRIIYLACDKHPNSGISCVSHARPARPSPTRGWKLQQMASLGISFSTR